MLDIKLWDEIFGHLNLTNLLFSCFLRLVALRKNLYEGCILGKTQQQLFSNNNSMRAINKFQLIHGDVCGPFNIQTRGGYEYFVTFTDDYSRFGYVYLMRHKSETFDKFKEYRVLVEK